MDSKNDVIRLVTEMLEDCYLFEKNGGPLKGFFHQGNPDSNSLIIVGPNASGKSFSVRLLSSWLNDEKTEPLQVSMKYRTQAGIHRAFMFGPFGDSEDSTGRVSVTAVEGAIRTAQGRESKHWLFFDEPDIGLAEGYAWAMGALIAECANDGPGPMTQGVVTVTHNKDLVRSLVENSKLTPHFLCMGETPLHLDEWLTLNDRRSVEDLKNLSKVSTEMYRAINRALEARKK